MKMSKLLKMLLLPFMLYVDGEEGGGGGASDSAGESEGSSGDSVDWGALNDGVDPGADDDGEEGSEGSSAPESSAASTGAAAAPKADAQATTDDEQQQTEGEEQKTDPQTPEPDDAAAQLTPEQIAEREKQLATEFSQWKEAETARLATEVYKISDEDAARLQTEPELVLPQIAAQLHLSVMQNTLEAVQRMLPNVLPQFQKQTETEKSAMDLFYNTNPDLKKYHNQVIQAGKMFRKLNPKAGPEEAAKKIGDMVRSALGLEPLKAGEAGTGGTQSSGKPAAKPAGGKPAPHRPAQPGSGSGVKAPKPKDAGGDLWAEMASDDD